MFLINKGFVDIIRSVHLSYSLGDFSDFLAGYLTSMILFTLTLGFCLFLSTGHPIKCWTGAQFPDNWVEYTESMCWTESTYWVPTEQQLPKSSDQRQAHKIGYYQWIPFVFLIQGLISILPHAFYKAQAGSGVYLLKSVIQVMRGTIDPLEWTASISSLARHICINHTARTFSPSCSSSTTNSGTSLLPNATEIRGSSTRQFAIYICVKFLHLSVAMGQLLILWKVLNHPSPFFGLIIARNLLSEKTWDGSGAFPRVTMCDFIVREIGQANKYTVQCVLPINMVYEKVFIILWFWFVLCTLCSLFSMCIWLKKLFGVFCHRQTVPTLLGLTRKLNIETNENEVVVRESLTLDGVFLMEMIDYHLGKPMRRLVEKEILNYYDGNSTKSKNDDDSAFL